MITELLQKIDIETLLMVGLTGAVAALLSGKFLRRLLLLPFEWLTRQTQTKVDDKLLDEARKDLGVTDATLPEDTNESRKG